MKTKKEKEKDERPADEEKPKEEELHCVTDAETEEGSKQSSTCDQDSDVSFHEDTDEEIDKGEIEEKDRVEYIKRSTKEAEEHMMKTKIACWIEAHRRMKWRLALRIASLALHRSHKENVQREDTDIREARRMRKN